MRKKKCLRTIPTFFRNLNLKKKVLHVYQDGIVRVLLRSDESWKREFLYFGKNGILGQEDLFLYKISSGGKMDGCKYIYLDRSYNKVSGLSEIISIMLDRAVEPVAEHVLFNLDMFR